MSKTKEHFEIEKAQSVIRTRVLEIRALSDDKLTDALRSERTELDRRFAEGEVKFRASLDALQIEQAKGVSTLDTADTELRELTRTANCGDVLSASNEQRQTNGATAELQQHYKLNSNQIPIEMLRLERGVEERAAATVPGSIAGAVQAQVITPVFASGDGAFLGVERPIQPVGTASFPLLSTSPSVKGPYTDSTEAGQTDATFVANSLAPERFGRQLRIPRK